MFGEKSRNVLLIVAVLVVAFLLKDIRQQKFSIPKPVKTLDGPDLRFNVTILGTNDLHSTFTGKGLKSYPESSLGGYSRLVHLINEIRSQKSAEGDSVLTIDAGDWFTGSLFDNLGASDKTISVPQMEFFHFAKFDAIILGNHEFDQGEDALYTILDKAKNLKLDINIIVSNLLPISPKSKFNQFYDESSSVKFIPYYIKETEAGRVGVLGYTAPDALFVSEDNRADLQFTGFTSSGAWEYNELISLARQQAGMLRSELRCDIVIAVIHGGHRDKEDVGFLNLPDIDVVLGGHTHELYFYRAEDSSLTSQCGYSGRQLTALMIGQDLDDKQLHFRGVDEKYKQFVSENSPQCIDINNHFQFDRDFEEKVGSWKNEIKGLTGFNQNEIVFKGNLQSLFSLSTSRFNNSQSFASMIVDQLNAWEVANKPQSDPVIAKFWTEEFFEMDMLTHDLSDVTLTFDDAYNLIFFSGQTDLHTFYMRKFDIYIALQLSFVVRGIFSPLINPCVGGIVYKETSYFGVPLITDMETVEGVPYEEWPELVRVVAGAIPAPYFWKASKYTFGVFANFPKDEQGNPVSLADTLAVGYPTELELLLNYLKNSEQNKMYSRTSD